MPAVFSRVNRDEPRPVNRTSEALGRACYQPVVRVHHVELEPFTQFKSEPAHVGVHVLNPAYECLHVFGELRLADTVDDHAVAHVLPRQSSAASGQDVHVDALADEVLGKLSNVPPEPALDHRRVLP